MVRNAAFARVTRLRKSTPSARATRFARDSFPGCSTANPLEFRREQALHHLEAVCEKFQTAGAPCTSNVRIGIPHDEILNEAAVIAPDLIVVGSTATAAFTRFLLGSTAERVGDMPHARFS